MQSLKEILGNESPKDRGAFVGGKWTQEGEKHGQIEVLSPANSEWKLPSLEFSYDVVDSLVVEARKAFLAWRDLAVPKRIEALQSFAKELDKRQDLIAKLIAIENGKPFDEAKVEASLLSKKINITIDYALNLVKTQKLELGAFGVGEIHWRPKGILAVIGPFNFPVHLSHGHIAPALLTGNVCVLKPSEKTPYCAQVYMEAAEASLLPKGVLQMLQGDAQVARRLIRHVDLDGVLATCSYEVGAKIQKDLAEKPEKIVALEMGGKNAAILWEIEDEEQAAKDLIRSSFLSTGQRCTALSRIYVKKALLDSLMGRVHQMAKELVIDQPFAESPKPFMGPLISEDSLKKYLRYAKIAETDSETEAIMRPKRLLGEARQIEHALPQGNYVSPSINYVKKWDAKSAYQNHEIFAPDMFFCPIDSIDEGIEAVNNNPYGLSFSLFCKEEKIFDQVADKIDCGLIYWNRPTVGASSQLPFGGWKRSGNHKPAGAFAIYASTQVQTRVK